MSLKTAWLNLQDGLGNRFAWSHVNAIYYSQAQNKLLKDKLDDMETAINGKVAKTDIVQVESTSQSTVPSSAYLKTVKDALDSDISELNSGQIKNRVVSIEITAQSESATGTLISGALKVISVAFYYNEDFYYATIVDGLFLYCTVTEDNHVTLLHRGTFKENRNIALIVSYI